MDQTVRGSQRNRDGLARFGIVTAKAFGVSVGEIRQYAKTIGRNHELAQALWETGWLEARMLAVFIDDPALVTPSQMDRWCRTVKKGVSWALRGIGHRNRRLQAAALRSAERLAASGDRTARWVGKDAIRDLSRRPAARP